MAAASTIATITAVAGALGAVGGAVQSFRKPKDPNRAAQANLQAQTDQEKRRAKLQGQQRKQTETFLTSGQGVAGQGSTLG